MIYGRSGEPCTIVRVGTLADVRTLDNRKPDKTDRAAVESGSYVVVRFVDDDTERLYHLAFLRADGGSLEVTRAIEGLPRERSPESTLAQMLAVQVESNPKRRRKA